MPGVKGQRRKHTNNQLVQQTNQAMQKLGTFTIPQLMEACTITRDAASKRINDLLKSGHVVKHQARGAGSPRGSHDVFRLLRPPEPVRRGVVDNQRQQVWQSMRILTLFTIPQLIATTGASRDNISRYLNRLIKAGYVVRQRGRVSGRAGSCDTFRLSRNTGPQAPTCWESGQVHDPNNGKTYEDGEEVAPTEPYGAF